MIPGEGCLHQSIQQLVQSWCHGCSHRKTSPEAPVGVIEIIDRFNTTLIASQSIGVVFSFFFSLSGVLFPCAPASQ
jgi:hypothetical protein